MKVSTKVKRLVAAAYVFAIVAIVVPARAYIQPDWHSVRQVATFAVGVCGWLVVVSCFVSFALTAKPERSWSGGMLARSSGFFRPEEEVGARDLITIVVTLVAIASCAVFLACRLIGMPR